MPNRDQLAEKIQHPWFQLTLSDDQSLEFLQKILNCRLFHVRLCTALVPALCVLKDFVNQSRLQLHVWHLWGWGFYVWVCVFDSCVCVCSSVSHRNKVLLSAVTLLMVCVWSIRSPLAISLRRRRCIVWVKGGVRWTFRGLGWRGVGRGR